MPRRSDTPIKSAASWWLGSVAAHAPAMASTGVGSPPHQARELFKGASGARGVVVPYRAAGQRESSRYINWLQDRVGSYRKQQTRCDGATVTGPIVKPRGAPAGRLCNRPPLLLEHGRCPLLFTLLKLDPHRNPPIAGPRGRAGD